MVVGLNIAFLHRGLSSVGGIANAITQLGVSNQLCVNVCSRRWRGSFILSGYCRVNRYRSSPVLHRSKWQIWLVCSNWEILQLIKLSGMTQPTKPRHAYNPVPPFSLTHSLSLSLSYSWTRGIMEMRTDIVRNC